MKIIAKKKLHVKINDVKGLTMKRIKIKHERTELLKNGV